MFLNCLTASSGLRETKVVNGNEWMGCGVERGGLVAFQTCFQHPIICVEMREPPSIILSQAFYFQFLN